MLEVLIHLILSLTLILAHKVFKRRETARSRLFELILKKCVLFSSSSWYRFCKTYRLGRYKKKKPKRLTVGSQFWEAIPPKYPSEGHSASCRRGSFYRGSLQLSNPANPGCPDVSLCIPTARSIQEKCSSKAGKMQVLLQSEISHTKEYRRPERWTLCSTTPIFWQLPPMCLNVQKGTCSWKKIQ